MRSRRYLFVDINIIILFLPRSGYPLIHALVTDQQDFERMWDKLVSTILKECKRGEEEKVNSAEK